MATEMGNYMSWFDSFEGKKEGKFMNWYHSYQGKKIVNVVYSVGASGVIVGALFKIMHWPGASIVLTSGMVTEAILFIIGVLEAPHEEFHWANVFPELLEYGSPDERVERSLAQMGMAPKGKGAEDKPKTNVPALSDAELASLKNGIADLAKTAGQLSELGKVATSTTKLGEKAEAAAEAAGKFAVAAESLGEKNEQLGAAYASVVTGMQGVAAGTENYKKNIEAIDQKLGSLNSIYELQIATIKAQADAYKAQTEQVNAATAQVNAATAQVNAVSAQVGAMAKDAEKMVAVTAEALKNQEAYEAASKKLAAQVADLNKVYGNMLNALA